MASPVLYPGGRCRDQGVLVGRNETKRLGKYMVLERVAEGPLTEVLRARLDGIAGFSRIFAIKRLRSDIARHADAQALVEARAREAAVLSHGNIVQLLDLSRENGVPYVVLEWVDGWSLTTLLGRADELSVTLPVGHATWIGLQVLKALEYAHHREIVRDGAPVVLRMVHGAVGTDDVLISRGGEVKLTDFGLARATDEVSKLDPTLIPAHPERRAPELATSDEPTIAADLWGAARVVRACLISPLLDELPFQPLQTLRPDVPDALAKTLDAALSVDPADRPANATEMKDAFTDLLHDLGDVTDADTLIRWITDAGLPPVPPLADDLPDADLPMSDQTDESASGVRDPDEENTSPVSMDEHIILDEDARTQVQSAMRPEPKAPAKPTWDENGATQVNPELARKLSEMREQRGVGFEGNADATRMRPTAGDVDLGQPDDSPPAQAAWRSGVWIGVVTLCVGVLLGGVGAALWGRAAGITVNDPMLDVRTAPDVQMTVTVDGNTIQGPTTLTPGAHQLRVDVAGAAPWLVDLTLQAGEYRLMMVEANRVNVTPPADAAPPSPP